MTGVPGWSSDVTGAEILITIIKELSGDMDETFSSHWSIEPDEPLNQQILFHRRSR